MKWIKGFLIFGMVMLAHSAVSINDVEANTKTAKAHEKKPHLEKKSSFSSFTSGLKGLASKVADGAKNLKDKASSAVKGKKNEHATKEGLFSSFTRKLKKVGHSLAAGAKNLKDKASSAAECRHGKGEAPGQELYKMAKDKKILTDAHVVAAHAPAAHAKVGHKK